MAEVVILGAGLTGLSVAYHLESHNYLNYSIFDQDMRPGGLLKTEQCNGFNFDYTGHYLHVGDKRFGKFLDNVADLNNNFDLISRRSSIFKDDTYLNYPFQRNLCGLPIDVIYECVNGFINRRSDIKCPKNFHDWVLKYFGAGMGRHFFYPYNGKLLSYNLKKVLPSWTGRFVPQTDLKTVLCGALQKSLDGQIGYNSSFYYPKNGGIEFLIKRIVARLSNNIKTAHKVVSIDLFNKLVCFENGHVEKYNYLVSTIPLKVLLNSMSSLGSQNYSKQAEKLICTSVINFNLGLKPSFIGNDHWTYFPEKQFSFYRLGFWHNISKSCVTPGNSGIYGETSFIQGTKSDKQINNLKAKAISQALHFLNVSANDVIAEKMLKIEYAYVIYDSWREKNLKKLLDALTEQNIYSAGRFGEWNYSSMQEAVLSGIDSANSILSAMKFVDRSKAFADGYFKSREMKRVTTKNLVA